jgi:hypothetical protein
MALVLNLSTFGKNKILMTRLSLILLLTFASVCVFGQITFKELAYGPCETKKLRQEKMSQSPTGTYTISDDIKILKKSKRMKGKIGAQFGIVYVLESAKTEDVTIEQVWIYPRTVVDDKGKRFTELRYPIERTTNQETYTTYSLDKPYEVVLGWWRYRAYYQGKMIFEKSFYVE